MYLTLADIQLHLSTTAVAAPRTGSHHIIVIHYRQNTVFVIDWNLFRSAIFIH